MIVKHCRLFHISIWSFTVIFGTIQESLTVGVNLFWLIMGIVVTSFIRINKDIVFNITLVLYEAVVWKHKRHVYLNKLYSLERFDPYIPESVVLESFAKPNQTLIQATMGISNMLVGLSTLVAIRAQRVSECYYCSFMCVIHLKFVDVNLICSSLPHTIYFLQNDEKACLINLNLLYLDNTNVHINNIVGIMKLELNCYTH